MDHSSAHHHQPSLLKTLAFGLLTLSALAVGLLSLRYALPGQPYAPELGNLLARRELLIVHALSAALALLVGPLQLAAALRRRRPALHRWGGRLYMAAVALGTLSALPLALPAETGVLASAGFLCLALLWAASSFEGLRHARARRYEQHRAWMIRSFALTAAAITLRLYLAAGAALGLPVEQSYPLIAWLCWLPNLLAAEAWLAHERQRARAQRAE
ncbi:DUF2306 domain-containing protein [Roseateles sp. DAIF2]|uniref:DUF2306 domain-containing protein n=1 Tax=Roseateles sp. DAIF2 TaxID=2714952 RepID=UPI0018A2C747|nr:DUF2306 domain-containing protein [Roseateles sp. DAIF2]QPF72236.1 DUF2306 domain-containing protein [Roseateles sp. DAIF2]